MNELPDDVCDKIYKYKHQMEYAPVMLELLEQFTDFINEDLYFENRRQLMRYLRNNINDINCIIFDNGRRLQVLEYIEILNRRVFN